MPKAKKAPEYSSARERPAVAPSVVSTQAPPALGELNPAAAGGTYRHPLQIKLMDTALRRQLPRLAEFVGKFVGDDGRPRAYDYDEPTLYMEAMEELLVLKELKCADKLWLLRRVLGGYDYEDEPPSISLAHRASDTAPGVRDRPVPLVVIYSRARPRELSGTRQQQEAQLAAQARRHPRSALPPPRAGRRHPTRAPRRRRRFTPPSSRKGANGTT